MISLTTDRLILRPFNENDLQNLIDLDTDPEVMKYLGAKLTSIDDLRKTLGMLLERQPRWKHYGTWATDLKSTGECVGWFTFKPVPKLDDDYEVGYRLKRKFWGRGIATEGAKMLVDYGFKERHLPKIIGLTHLENKASQQVLKKCGLKEVGAIDNPFDFIEGKVLLLERLRDSV